MTSEADPEIVDAVFITEGGTPYSALAFSPASRKLERSWDGGGQRTYELIFELDNVLVYFDITDSSKRMKWTF